MIVKPCSQESLPPLVLHVCISPCRETPLCFSPRKSRGFSLKHSAPGRVSSSWSSGMPQQSQHKQAGSLLAAQTQALPEHSTHNAHCEQTNLVGHLLCPQHATAMAGGSHPSMGLSVLRLAALHRTVLFSETLTVPSTDWISAGIHVAALISLDLPVIQSCQWYTYDSLHGGEMETGEPWNSWNWMSCFKSCYERNIWYGHFLSHISIKMVSFQMCP